GWPWWIFVLIVVAAATLFGFIKYEFSQFKKGFSTLLVPPLFKVRTFSAGIAVMLVFAMAFIGFFFTYTLTLQIGLDFSALKTALIGIPVAIGIMISAAALVRKLLPKLGGRVMTVGAVILGIGLILIALALERYGLHTTWYELLPGLFIFGMGMGMLFAAVFAVLYNDVDPQFAGAASGLQNAVQQVAGAIGVAIVGVILFAAIKSNAVNSINSVIPQLKTQLSSLSVPPPAQAAVIHNLKRCYVTQASSSDPSKTPKGCEQPAATSPVQKRIGQAAATAATKANQKNFSHSFSITVYYDLALLFIAFLVSLLLPRHLKHPEAAGEAA
ncbi:MAG: MFS transporter, partial [Candidatus Saccharimonadales bacterium]